MARYTGVIGVRGSATETSPGIFESTVDELPISGEVRIKPSRWRGGELQHNELKANHVISIIAPESTISSWGTILYVTWQGKKWVVTGIEYIRPRINLNLGGLYNG